MVKCVVAVLGFTLVLLSRLGSCLSDDGVYEEDELEIFKRGAQDLTPCYDENGLARVRKKIVYFL